MKHLYLILLPIVFVACSKKDQSNPTTFHLPTVYKDTGAIYFISNPLSATQVQFSFPSYPTPLSSITLRNDTGILGVFPITPGPQINYTATVTYPFQPGQQYTFTVETTPTNGLAYRYILRNYVHTYLAPFTWQKLLSFTQLQGYDISPSRNTLFAMDYAQNTLNPKKLSLIDGTVTPIAGNMYNYSPIIRAINDNDILAEAGIGKTPQGLDSGILYRLNTTTGQTSNIAYVSNNYARYSRIIDNHILTTLPLFPGNSELIDLADTSKLIISYDIMNFTLVGQDNFDHIYYDNEIVDPATGALQTVLPPGNDSASAILLDSTTQYLFLGTATDITTVPPNILSYKTSFSIYTGNNLVYQIPYILNRSMNFPKQADINNNRILFYQSFGWDTTFRISGYYQLDLNTKTISLVECYPTSGDDFQLTPHSMISVQPGGVFKVAIP